MSVYYKIPSISDIIHSHTHSTNKLSDTKLSNMISHNNLKWHKKYHHIDIDYISIFQKLTCNKLTAISLI